MKRARDKGQSRRRRDAGFTLIELLVALVLVSMIAAILAAALGGLSSAQRTTQQRLAEGSAEPARAYIRRALSESLALRLRPQTSQLLDGGPRVLTFVSAHAPLGDFAGPVRLEWRVEPSATHPGTFDLEETRTRYRLAPTQQGQGAQKSRLLRGATSISFSYATADGTWAPTWATTGALPALVRIEIEPGLTRAERRTALIVGIATGR